MRVFVFFISKEIFLQEQKRITTKNVEVSDNEEYEINDISEKDNSI